MHKICARSLLSLIVLASSVGYCDEASIEILDEATGMTAGVLRQPFALVETGIFDILDTDSKQASIVYLGPVEWDRSGELTYMLWVELAPGVGGHPLDDIRSPGAVKLKLDDGIVTLAATEIEKANSPYRLKISEDRSAYFGIDVATLKRLATSRKPVLNVRAADLSIVTFQPTHEMHTLLSQFVQERAIAEN